MTADRPNDIFDILKHFTCVRNLCYVGKTPNFVDGPLPPVPVTYSEARHPNLTHGKTMFQHKNNEF